MVIGKLIYFYDIFLKLKHEWKWIEKHFPATFCSHILENIYKLFICILSKATRENKMYKI